VLKVLSFIKLSKINFREKKIKRGNPYKKKNLKIFFFLKIIKISLKVVFNLFKSILEEIFFEGLAKKYMV
jgi:hypothetical protein